MTDTKPEKPTWFSVLEKDIENLEERLGNIENILKNLPESLGGLLQGYDDKRLKPTLTSLLFAIGFLAASPTEKVQLTKEMEEIKSIARSQSKTFQEIIAELRKNNTLPPTLAVLFQAVEQFKTMINI